MPQKSSPSPKSTDKPDAILVRHFPTPLNERNVSRGHLPIGIDKELAKELAPEVARILDEHGITRLISSDLPRAEQSAKVIAQYMENEPEMEHTEQLREPGDEPAKEPIGKTVEFGSSAREEAAFGKTLENPDWQGDQVRYEVNRLKAVLRDPNATAEERAIAQAQLENYLQQPAESTVGAKQVRPIKASER